MICLHLEVVETLLYAWMKICKLLCSIYFGTIYDSEISTSLFILGLFLKRLNGSSGACETFGNLCLAHDQEFELKNVEVFLFLKRLTLLSLV